MAGDVSTVVAMRDVADQANALGRAIADRLHTGTAESWPVAKAKAKTGDIYAMIFGSTCRVRATRARADLGWQPKHALLLRWIREEA